MNVQEFSVNDPILREMFTLGKSMLSSARVFEDVFNRITDRLRKGQQVDDYLTAELYKGYALLQTHHKAHDPEAGKRFAAEVRKWQRAKVRVPHRDEPQPFLNTTPSIAANFEKVHAWFE